MEKLTLDIQEILKAIPHRYPFLLVDRILEFVPGKKVVGLKNVTVNEPFFAGHFPGFPVMPGVLIIEAMAQTGAVGYFAGKESNKIMFLASVDKARFRGVVRPGDQIIITVDFLNLRENFGKVKAVAAVDGKKVAECEMMYALQEKS